MSLIRGTIGSGSVALPPKTVVLVPPNAPAAVVERIARIARSLTKRPTGRIDAPMPARGRAQSLVAMMAPEAKASQAAATTSRETGSGVADVAHAGDSNRADAEPAPAQHGASGQADFSHLTMDDLIRDHADAVYRVALSVTRDPSLAEDASQDAIIKAWQALPTFRGDAPIRNWILRITHNTAISLLRKRRDELRDPDMMPERASLRSVETAVQDRLAIDRFEEALADLDSVSRSIVVLREVEGLSYSELCEVLDLPMPTIKTRLLRARRQLASALEGWQP